MKFVFLMEYFKKICNKKKFIANQNNNKDFTFIKKLYFIFRYLLVIFIRLNWYNKETELITPE